MQIDFTEGRLALKVDPSGVLLASFIDLNNLALARFSAEERKRIGVHTCPGGDLDSTHSADVDYAELLPSLLQLNLANYYIAMAGETRSPPDEIARMVADPDVEYTTTPKQLMAFVDFMRKVGRVKHTPQSWKDLFLPEAQALSGS